MDTAGSLRTCFCFVFLMFLVVFPKAAAAQIYESIGIRAQGMSGAFVAVADDATATWWNPAGLAGSGLFNAIVEFDRIEESSLTRARGFSLTVSSLGLSYYRLALSGIRFPGSGGSTAASREDQGALNQFGATVGQSLGRHFVLASTLKLVNALGDTHADLDMGAMAAFGGARIGVAVKNLRTPEFQNDVQLFELQRQVRTGFSFKAGSGSSLEVTAAVDGDLTSTSTPYGPARHLATGVEVWLGNRAVGLRGGVGVNTIGETRRSGSVGASVAFRRGAFIDAQLTRGDDFVRNGWGFALRLTF